MSLQQDKLVSLNVLVGTSLRYFKLVGFIYVPVDVAKTSQIGPPYWRTIWDIAMISQHGPEH